MDGGIVHPHVEATEALECGLLEPLHSGLVADVGRHRDGARATLLALSCGLPQRLLASSREDE